MKIPNSLKSVALVTLTAASTAFLIQACGGSDAQAQSTSDADAIEGVWESNVTITDCTTSAVVRTFKGAGQFHRGGSLTADNSLPPSTRGTAFGLWKRDAASAYTANFRFLRFNADGSLAGSQKVHRTLTLSADGNGLTGTLTGQVIDPAGTVVQSICGSEVSTRIY
jgi:hypothetical protein